MLAVVVTLLVSLVEAVVVTVLEALVLAVVVLLDVTEDVPVVDAELVEDDVGDVVGVLRAQPENVPSTSASIALLSRSTVAEHRLSSTSSPPKPGESEGMIDPRVNCLTTLVSCSTPLKPLSIHPPNSSTSRQRS